MRDIQLVLEKWGGWASSESSGVDYSSIAAGFKGLLVSTSKQKLSCSDDDGIIIDSAIARLRAVRKKEELELIVAYYMCGISKRAIAKEWRMSEGRIRQMMQVAEGFIDGCLSILGVVLEMDDEVKKQQKIMEGKKVLVRYAKSMLV